MIPAVARAHKSQRLAVVALVSVAMVWGATFVLTQHAIADFDVFTFLAWRFFIASLAFGVFFLKPLLRAFRRAGRSSVRIALVAGVFLALGYVFQTFGMIPASQGGTTPARTAFITGLFVVFVPLGQWVLTRRRPRMTVLVGVVLAVIGLYLLSGMSVLSSSQGWVWGDSMVLICAVAYAVHMLVLGRTTTTDSTVLLTFIQLVVVLAICVTMSLFTGKAGALPQGYPLWFALIVCGVFASAYAFAVQTWAQTIMQPAQVALTLIMEPVFGGLFGWFSAGNAPKNEVIGALFLLGAMLFAELRMGEGARKAP